MLALDSTLAAGMIQGVCAVVGPLLVLAAAHVWRQSHNGKANGET